MRRWNIAIWLGEAALLCVIASCSAPAHAQSISDEVSASSSNVQAEVGASVEGGGTGSANFSGRGRGSNALRRAIIPANSSAMASHRLRGTASGMKDSALKNVSEHGRPAANRMVGMERALAAHGPEATEAALTRARMKSFASLNSGAIHRAVTQPVSYSTDFQDSTRGTALISPFDPGTTGPFAFKPEMNAGLPDFSNRIFLSPSLHVGGGSGRKGTGRRGARKRALASVGSQSGSSSISDDFGLDVKKDSENGLTSDPAADLGVSVSTSGIQ